ncbi:MAG: MoxR family ATPase [Pseudomonadota bacterium]|jgi:MoxR-like ATPase
MNTDIGSVSGICSRIRTEMGKVIIGQDEAIDLALVVIMCRQHALIEGVPGIAKTLLVKTLSRIMGGTYARIQFTPDLMPSDITGTNIYNMKTSEFTFVPGPVFASFLLADEVNRAPAKTQSALLQAMQERMVTIDAKSYSLPENFTVFATQNPIEYEGTYPLPEAQKDRFMFKIPMSAPQRDDELLLAQRMLRGQAPETVLASREVNTVMSLDQLDQLETKLSAIMVQDELTSYVVDIVRATRNHDSVLVGASPRATQALILASRAYAVLSGRDFVTPDDIKAMTRPVLDHRLILRPDYEIEGTTTTEVIDSILDQVPIPR